MATLPDVTSLPSATPQPAGGTAAYEPPNWRQVGMAGEIISSAGRGFQDAANTIAATNDRQDGIVAQAAANALRDRAISLQYDPDKGFANAKEGAAVGQQFVTDYSSRLTDATQSIREQLQNPNQQRIFDQHSQIVGMQFKSDLLKHQAQQTSAFNDSTDNNTVEQALRSMSQRPLDDLAFQTGLSQIDGTINSMAQRKGLPDVARDVVKGKYLDAAYGTRILSVMNGIPGVVQANPYLAEKMFDQLQDKLGPAAQVTLAGEVQRAVQQVQQRDLAQKIVSGGIPVHPDALAPAIAGVPALDGLVKELEASSPTAVSPKGAQGEHQVMPETQANPGYGVRPATMGADGKPLPGEIERVGRDYLGAMTARYETPALILAAYNAGPGRVDQWLTRFGDPRAGQISAADWAAKIPFDETRNYVTSGLQKLAAAVPSGGTDAAQLAGTTGASGAVPVVGVQPQGLTTNDLKTRLPALMEQARSTWQAMYPNDPVGADGAATRVASYAQLQIAGQQAQQEAARDTLTRGMIGAAPDGSQRARTMDQLLADPAMKAAWNSATPEVQMAIQDRMKVGGDPQRTPQTQQLVYQLMGEYSNDKQGFANRDLTPLISQLPFADFDKLTGLQVAARNKQELDADKSINLQHAMGIAEMFALKPAGIFVPTKDTPASKRAIYDQYTGMFTEELDDFKAKNGRRPNDDEMKTMAKNLTAQVTAPGRWWGSNTTMAFQTPLDTKVTVPDDFRAGITAAIKARGAVPTEAQIQTAYLTSLRTAPKK